MNSEKSATKSGLVGWCDLINESCWEVLSFGAVYHAVIQNGSYFLSDGNPQVWPFQRKLMSSSCVLVLLFFRQYALDRILFEVLPLLWVFSKTIISSFSGSFGNSRKGIWRNVLHQIFAYLLPQTKMEVPGLFARNFTWLFPRHSFSRLFHTGKSLFFRSYDINGFETGNT